MRVAAAVQFRTWYHDKWNHRKAIVPASSVATGAHRLVQVEACAIGRSHSHLGTDQAAAGRFPPQGASALSSGHLGQSQCRSCSTETEVCCEGERVLCDRIASLMK
eukprot:5572088-Amphidinium_carterae.1